MTDTPHEKQEYIQPVLQRLGDVASLTASGSGNGTENMIDTAMGMA